MAISTSYVSGKIGTRQDTGWTPDILPKNLMADTRNDALFFIFFFAVIIIFALLAIFKTKIFGRALGEYLQPIWYYILIAILAVMAQYTIDLNDISLRATQWLWELMIVLSVYKLIRKYDFNLKNIFFLAILYSLIIHGLKVSIRYFFYDKTIYYVADRFFYGSLLVFIVALGSGIIFLYVIKKRN